MNKALPYNQKDPYSIEQYAKRLIDKKLRDFVEKGEIDKDLIKDNTIKKGSFGQALEKFYFLINPGSESAPDFRDAGVELKSSPLKRTKEGLWSKERLVLNIINFMDIVNEKWATSSFIRKNALLLLIFYLYEKDVPIIDLLVKLVGLWEYPAQDMEIIKQDWHKIVNKIKQGKAHEISEGDTLYLGACTKGATAETKRPQPYSTVMAKQRAFAFKQKYVNYMIRELLGRQKFHIADTDKIVKDPKELERKSLEDIVIGKFKPFYNMTTTNIARKLKKKIKPDAKNFNDIITRAILGVERSKIEEFEKADVNIKSIVLDEKGNLKESISFPYFKYTDIIKEKDWDSSELKQMLERRFFFVVYKKDKSGQKKMIKAMFWNIPFNDLNVQIAKVWTETIKRIKQGRYNELPKITDSPVAHIRPHGQNAKDVCDTPDGRTATKKCFWLNAKYIQSQIGK